MYVNTGYKVPNFGGGEWFNAAAGVVNNMNQTFIEQAAENRKMEFAIQEQLSNIDYAEIQNEKIQQDAAQAIKEIEDAFVNAHLYEYDDQGNQIGNKRGFKKGKITDQDYFRISKKIQDLDKNITARKGEYEYVKKAQDEFSKNPNSYDPDAFAVGMKVWNETGRVPKPFLEPAEKDMSAALINMKTPDLGYDKTPTSTGTITKDRTLDRDKKSMLYYAMATEDYGYRKWLVNKMLTDPNLSKEELDTMLLAAGSKNPDYDLGQYQSAEITPDLQEAAIFWGDKYANLPDLIDMPAVKTDFDETLRPQREKGDTQETVSMEGRPIRYNGYVSKNAFHIGESMPNFVIPEGTQVYKDLGGGKTERSVVKSSKPVDVVFLDYDADKNKVLIARKEDVPESALKRGATSKGIDKGKIYSIDGDKIDALGLPETIIKKIKAAQEQYKSQKMSTLKGKYNG